MRTRALAIGLAIAGCSTAPSPRAPAPCPPLEVAPAVEASSTAELVAPALEGPPPVGAPRVVTEVRDRGLARWREGDIEGAVAVLREAAGMPEHRRVDEALLAAALQDLARRQQAAALELGKIEAIHCEAPPDHAVTRAPLAIHGERPKRIALAPAPRDLAQRPPTFLFPVELGRAPASTPSSYRGQSLRAQIDEGDRRIYVFGGGPFGSERIDVALAATDAAPARVLELDGFVKDRLGAREGDVLWLQVRDGVLYAEDAAMSATEPAFVVAYDVATGKLLWRSKNGVANATGFVVADTFVACLFNDGRGVWALTLLDRATGDVLVRRTGNGMAFGPWLEEGLLAIETSAGHFRFEAKP